MRRVAKRKSRNVHMVADLSVGLPAGDLDPLRYDNSPEPSHVGFSQGKYRVEAQAARERAGLNSDVYSGPCSIARVMRRRTAVRAGRCEHVIQRDGARRDTDGHLWQQTPVAERIVFRRLSLRQADRRPGPDQLHFRELQVIRHVVANLELEKHPSWSFRNGRDRGMDIWLGCVRRGVGSPFRQSVACERDEKRNTGQHIRSNCGVVGGKVHSISVGCVDGSNEDPAPAESQGLAGVCGGRSRVPA